MLGLMYIKGEGVQKNHNFGMMMVRNAAREGNEEAKKYLRKVSLTDRTMVEFDEIDTTADDPDTPDIIGGVKGAENGKGLFSFLRRRF